MFMYKVYAARAAMTTLTGSIYTNDKAITLLF